MRVTAQSLNRLMGLAGESLVQARWLPSFSTALLVLKKHHDRLAVFLDSAFHSAAAGAPADQLALSIADARRQAAMCRSDLTDKSTDFDDHAARAEDLNSRLYREVIVSRMRPFGDGVHGLPRLVRDMSRSLGKEAKLVIDGEQTEVDRDILEKLESPLSHLIRNAVDHGIEPPEIRTGAGKPAAGTIRLEARHRAGMLQVTISDDGGGVDLEKLRRKIIDRGLSSTEVVRKMHEAELLEFLFLPGFSTAKVVTEFSGRGVGLDVVQDTIRKVGGSVRITTPAWPRHRVSPATAAHALGDSGGGGERVRRTLRVSSYPDRSAHPGLPRGRAVGRTSPVRDRGRPERRAGRRGPVARPPGRAGRWRGPGGGACSATQQERTASSSIRFGVSRTSSSARSTRASARSRISAPRRSWTMDRPY